MLHSTVKLMKCTFLFLQSKYKDWFTISDYVFLAIYSLEFLLKVYAEPIGYWLSAYNIFDFVVLVISGVQVNCIL